MVLWKQVVGISTLLDDHDCAQWPTGHWARRSVVVLIKWAFQLRLITKTLLDSPWHMLIKCPSEQSFRKRLLGTSVIRNPFPWVITSVKNKNLSTESRLRIKIGWSRDASRGHLDFARWPRLHSTTNWTLSTSKCRSVDKVSQKKSTTQGMCFSI